MMATRLAPSRRVCASRLALLALFLPAGGCIEDRLSVDVMTRVFSDGSCHRRVEYSLERVDPEKDGGLRLPIPPTEDPLRLLHRFPGAPWTREDKVSEDRHTVVLEAQLDDCNAADGDYFRVRAPGSAFPASNHMSVYRFEDEGKPSWEYRETFFDPASPLAGSRRLVQLLAERAPNFAEALLAKLQDPRIDAALIEKAYREHLIAALERSLVAIERQAAWGLKERGDLEALWKDPPSSAGLVAALLEQAPGLEAGAVQTAIDDALATLTDGEAADSVTKILEREGLPLSADLASERSTRVRFRVTLLLPGPIARANTCAQGNTASWEFDQDDLYGRGFEMWARAVTR